MEKLLEYLATIPVGNVTDTAVLADLLADCWNEFAGSEDSIVPAAELIGRVHNVMWRSPRLSFDVAPNGGKGAGGRGQRWTLNLEEHTATLAKPAQRPAAPPRPKTNASDTAEQITRLVVDRRDDFRLRWYSDGSVRIAVGIIFPEGVGFKQTVSNRRRKFRMAVDEKLTAAGWRRVKDYVYAPPVK